MGGNKGKATCKTQLNHGKNATSISSNPFEILQSQEENENEVTNNDNEK